MPRFNIKNYLNNNGEFDYKEVDGKLVMIIGEKEYSYKLGGKSHKWFMRGNYVDMNRFGYTLNNNRFRYTWKIKENELINNLRTLDNDVEVMSLDVNLNELSVERISYLISTHLPVSNDLRAYSIDFGNYNYFIYNQNLKTSLLTAIDNTLVDEGDDEPGSDTIAIVELFKADKITIRKIIKGENVNTLLGGQFFKHINITDMNLTDFGIFNKHQFKIKNKNGYFKNNCLCYAIVEALKYNNIKSSHKIPNKIKFVESLNVFFNTDFTPKKKVKEIFKVLKLNVNVRFIDNKKNGGTRLDKHRYGEEDDEILLIGLIDKHYFAIKPTHYSYKMLGENYKGRFKNLDSWTIIKHMIRNNFGIRDFKFNEKITTHFYSDKDLGSIENEKILTDTFELRDSKIKKVKILFFDCETITHGETHEVYMCDYVDEKEIGQKFDGRDCCKNFLNSLKGDVLLIAHNADYDIKFLIPHLFALSGIFKGKRCIGLKGKYNGRNGKNYNITIKDSLQLISTKLANFPKYFDFEKYYNMKVHKEFMPYGLYDEEIFTNKWKKISDAEKYCKNNEEKEILHNNIKRWNLIKKEDNEYFNALRYSHNYCLIDCLVLKKGYDIFRKWILEQLNIDINGILTSASLSQRYMEEQGCFDNCLMLGGACRAFIQECVVGGRCMSRNNKKYLINKKIADYDATSLYPSAMERLGKELGGYLEGVPKLLTDKTMKFLNSVDGYFIKILFKKNFDKKYSFPLLSYKTKISRKFSNELEGKYIHIDKISLEDVMKFYELTEEDFEIIEGYYFNEGRNNNIQSVIRKVFDMRLEKKAEKNPIEQVYKLIMNSAYGKTLIKPYDTETKVIDTKKKCDNYILKNHNVVKTATEIHNSEKFIIKESNSIITHFSYPHIGVEILSMSKRIMNEVMCLAEDNDIKIYYQDTDSMHIEFDKVSELERLFKEKYGKILNGKNMGQFHVDFDSKILDEDLIYSSKCIILGKKCYLDVLEDGSGEKDYHCRMKGIPPSTLNHTAKKMNLNLCDMYEYNLTNAIEYDLLEDGNRCRFLTNDNMSVSMAKKFTRNLKFNNELIVVN